MATKRISELSELLSASLSTVVAGVYDGSTYKISIDTIKTAIGATTIDTGSFITNSQTGSFVKNNQTASFSTTGSNTFTGIQTITGSYGTLIYGSNELSGYNTLADIHAYNDIPWLERFYNDSFSSGSAVMAYFAWNDGRFVFHNESTQSIGIHVNGWEAQNGLLIYPDKVSFVNNIEVVGGITGSLYNEAFSKNRTTTGSLNIIKQYQSIFNPSDLLIQENDIFIVEQNAEYYVLGDVINSGSLVVDGVFKIGGAFNNPGSLTGNGIIE